MDTGITPVDGKSYFGVTNPKPKSELSMETFLKLLTTQLANQNPLEPMNDRDFFAQLAQLGTVQGMDNLDDSLQTQQASSIIGKSVVAVRPMSEGGENSIVEGVARKLVVKNGERYLAIEEANGGMAEVKVGNIREIRETPIGSDPIDKMISLANAGNLIGKTIVTPHPTLRDTDGKPETLQASVKKVSFEGGTVFLSVTDRLGKDVKVRLQDVTGFGA